MSEATPKLKVSGGGGGAHTGYGAIREEVTGDYFCAVYVEYEEGDQGEYAGKRAVAIASQFCEAVNAHDRLQRMAAAGEELVDVGEDLIRERADRPSYTPAQRSAMWFRFERAIAAYEAASKDEEASSE